MKIVSLVVVLLLFFHQYISFAQPQHSFDPYEIMKEEWVDSVFRSLTLDEQIAQLMVIRAYSNRDNAYIHNLSELIRQYDIGGVCFFQGSPVAQATLTNSWQEAAKTPLLIAIDAEWGLGMRLDSVHDFPFQMTLGASPDDSLAYEMAAAIARDCRRMGIHMNLAPVVDVNNNPKNPVINFRSFGENPSAVARKGVLYMKGLQENGIVATAKHFPGHGDTDTDSHLDLPVINHPEERMESVELFPFREVINNRIQGIMIAHLYIPTYDNTPDLASTLSHVIVTGLLKQQMGFQGMVITDALDMKGVTRFFPPGEIEVKALLAGNDILLLPQNVPVAVQSIRQAVENGIIPRETIESRCLKMLQLKFDLGLDFYQPVNLENLTADLNPCTSMEITNRIYKSAVTVVKNENNLLPLTMLQQQRIASVSIGANSTTPFQQSLRWYAPVTHFQVSKDASPDELQELEKNLKPFNLVIVGIHRNNLYPANHFGNPEKIFDFVADISQKKRTILALFGNPYLVQSLKNTSDLEAILVTYQDQPVAEEVAAGIIFGGIPARGKLPVTTAGFPSGTGVMFDQTRLEFALPEEVGIPSEKLASIDSLVINGIDSAAYPGCQVLFAKDGHIFYYKAFGNPSYEDKVPVTTTDLYDIASLTKVAATTLAMMKLYEEGKIHPDDPLSIHLPELRGTDKEKITIREVMAHQAGLHPWIPFFELTLADSLAEMEIFDTVYSAVYPIRVADHFYMKRAYTDSIFQWIIRAEPRKNKEYKYSDLGFYLLVKLVERKTGRSFQDYVNETFYRPLGLTTMGFLPLERFPISRIMPAENDTHYRKQLIRGDVHDPGAAMLGGISGHAGLFSDAFDLAVILQMLLNQGEYGRDQYLLPSTIREFTRKQFPGKESRRGMGFDKPPPEYDPYGPTCEAASPTSFGHSGFTGTYMWADPANGLIYVFLSNRIYPDAANPKISQMNIRTGIHQKMYEIIKPEIGK
ncbi:MAG: glycoside hydrolase family 3 N-terminal domain-containing protein [Bacteroidota bacterium]